MKRGIVRAQIQSSFAYFLIAAIAAGIVMCIHVWADYNALSTAPMTNSAPPWVRFLIAIPYAIAILIAWVLAVICGRKYMRSETDK